MMPESCNVAISCSIVAVEIRFVAFGVRRSLELAPWHSVPLLVMTMTTSQRPSKELLHTTRRCQRGQRWCPRAPLASEYMMERTRLLCYLDGCRIVLRTAWRGVAEPASQTMLSRLNATASLGSNQIRKSRLSLALVMIIRERPAWPPSVSQSMRSLVSDRDALTEGRTSSVASSTNSRAMREVPVSSGCSAFIYMCTISLSNTSPHAKQIQVSNDRNCSGTTERERKGVIGLSPA